MPKIGRNNPCPCGSGKKYKRCHGSWESLENIERETHVTMKARIAAQHVQRERQQGLGVAACNQKHPNQQSAQFSTGIKCN